MSVAALVCCSGQQRRDLLTRTKVGLLLLVVLCAYLPPSLAPLAVVSAAPSAASNKGNSNNWAVIVSSSRYLFNYRHTANALTMYHTLRQHGIDDDHILLFLSDSFACDPRNVYPAEIFAQPPSHTGDLNGHANMNLYGCSAQVDYSGSDVDVRRFLSVLQGRYDENTPPTRRLLSDENSNIIIYVAGHGAKSFFKFQDVEFLSSSDIAETLTMMHQQRRYGRIVFLADTCHAIALCEHITAPNVICLAASSAEAESYSDQYEPSLGVHLISFWMNEMYTLLNGTSCSDPKVKRHGQETVSALHQSWYDFNYHPRRAEISGGNADAAHRDAVNSPQAIRRWKVADFVCGEEPAVELINVRYDLD
ncbi:putative GPI-anchor transamidase subunit 8 (GPI8) [Leptomonas seymouri]|uniref:Putative GPI-anchor transamidase subunit 8 (GPI8) n=1 Tax=Leptomonas seymouri TaxID=5684 RepID=A0A0N1IJ31_LEPSE|nr:putative GPI-anchor transamidase subunit 8 (GPI8) [Leptomonas seymouri]|eukprot:KPI84728.1 putative GPI-anchor transamidase subunit 8 (GPI8) [Leptomonas seymouri]